MDGLGLGFATAGLLGSAFGVSRFLTDVPAGMLVERRGAAGALHAGIGVPARRHRALRLGADAPGDAPGARARRRGLRAHDRRLHPLPHGAAGRPASAPGAATSTRWPSSADRDRSGARPAERAGRRARAGAGASACALGAVALGWLVAAVRVVPATREALAPRPRSAASGSMARRADWGAIGAIYLATAVRPRPALGVVGRGGRSCRSTAGVGSASAPTCWGAELSAATIRAAGVPVQPLRRHRLGRADVLGRLRVLVPGVQW